MWRWDGVKWMATSLLPGFGTPVTVTGSTTLPTAAVLSVNVNNTSGAPITITLPAATVNDQTYMIKDVAGNAATYGITIHPTTGTIDGKPDFYMYENYQAIELYWAAGLWGVR
jgi:hypothetical protein